MPKHLEVEHNKVLLNPQRPGMIFCFICTALYLMTMAGSVIMAVSLVANGRFPLPPLVSLLFWTAVWAFLMRNYNCRIVFDGAERKVYRRTMLGYKELMDFSDMGGITPVSQTSQGCDAGTYYALTSKGDRYGGGVRITTDLYDKELAAFEAEDLPKLFALLESRVPVAAPGSESPVRDTPVSGPREDMVYFRRDGDCFTRFSLFRMVALAAIFVAFLLIAAINPSKGGASLLIAGVVAILSFLAPVKLVLDSGERTVKQVWGWGLLKSAYPYDRFSHFNSTRQSVNFIPIGTHFSMVMEDPGKPGKEKRIQIAYGYSTRRFDRMAEEIQLAMGIAADAGEGEGEGGA